MSTQLNTLLTNIQNDKQQRVYQTISRIKDKDPFSLVEEIKKGLTVEKILFIKTIENIKEKLEEKFKEEKDCIKDYEERSVYNWICIFLSFFGIKMQTKITYDEVRVNGFLIDFINN